MEVRHVKCDVLVVGGGLSALRAAIEAKRQGADVAIAVKKKLGKSGNVIVSHTGFNAPFGHADERDNAQAYFQDTIIAGQLINNQRLVKILTHEACARVAELEKFGVKFGKSGKKYNQQHAPGHSYARSCYTPGKRGLNLTLPLLKVVYALGIRAFEDTMIVAITQEEGYATGAVGFNRISGEIISFASKAVILATGGAGQLFSMTNNVTDATGDGYSMAFNAGADLLDMEFFQFYPQMLIYPFKTLVSPVLFKHGAKLFNVEGERFMQKYDPINLDAATRDIKSRGIALEVIHGKGVKGGVYLDLSEVAEEDLKAFDPLLYEQVKRRGLDYRKAEFIVSPVAHFYMGGVKINEKCETTIKGLYACGEVAGGVHGANRLANNALTEAIVFGARAGKYAAKWARLNKKVKSESEDETSLIKRQLKKLDEGHRSVQEIEKPLRRLMWKNVGIVRNKEGLEETLAFIKESSSLTEEIKAENSVEKIRALELLNMLNVAKIMATSALTRTESRGAHYRSDYPETNNEKWLKNILIRRGEKGELKVSLSKCHPYKINSLCS
ncbi:MAG: FAD-binding protein [Candidatus Bathyarchaeia archaeon]